MSQLVAYYDEAPIDVKGRVEVQQAQRGSASGVRTVDGPVRSKMIYVAVRSLAEVLLVPFGDYDEWFLRDRYNEALRIMNSLGAKTIVCEAFGEVEVRRGLRAVLGERRGGISQRRVLETGFDYHHDGDGSEPRDPRPLRWPDEPGFAAAVSSVLENGSTEVTFNIRSTKTHAIDGSLGIKLKDLGFDLGGSSEKSGATTLHISATFPAPQRGWRGRR